MHLLDYDLWVMAVYRPPSYAVAEIFMLIEVITTFCEGREVVVLRDFNLPSVKWSADAMFHGVSQNDQVFIDFCCFWYVTMGTGIHFCRFWEYFEPVFYF